MKIYNPIRRCEVEVYKLSEYLNFLREMNVKINPDFDFVIDDWVTEPPITTDGCCGIRISPDRFLTEAAKFDIGVIVVTNAFEDKVEQYIGKYRYVYRE